MSPRASTIRPSPVPVTRGMLADPSVRDLRDEGRRPLENPDGGKVPERACSLGKSPMALSATSPSFRMSLMLPQVSCAVRSFVMPDMSLKFLIVDDNPDSRFLLAKTLLRKFPRAAMLESETGDRALAILSQEKPTVIIAHRAEEVDGATLIRSLRDRNPTVPIVMVSGIDRTESARLSGANSFLHYDEWLRIGTVVAELLKSVTSESPESDRR